MINSGARAAYRSGWVASKRTTTYDLDAAQQRFERTHGTAHSSAFIDGWIDFAADNGFDPPAITQEEPPMTEHTCTVVVSATSGPERYCGKPAVTSFTSNASGVTYYECREHDARPISVTAAPVLFKHPPTRSRRPFLLLRNDSIVGYADSRGPAVMARARRLGAVVVPNTTMREG